MTEEEGSSIWILKSPEITSSGDLEQRSESSSAISSRKEEKEAEGGL